MKARILHLYPKQMNIYGDMGNVIALRQRLKWRGIDCEVINIEPKQELDITGGDILFLGGGQDKGQAIIETDFLAKSKIISKAIEEGTPALFICGGYQLMGKYFTTSEGKRIKGSSIFNIFTRASEKRMIGNIVLDSDKFGRLVGFENHSGQTFISDKKSCLGKVSKGFGNNGEDKTEGIIYKNAIGTYLHGSFLPKNPAVCDFLIEKACKQLNQNFILSKLDNKLENKTRSLAAALPQ